MSTEIFKINAVSQNCEQQQDLGYVHTLFIYLHAARVNNTNFRMSFDPENSKKKIQKIIDPV